MNAATAVTSVPAELRTRILLIDDHDVVRKGLRLLLETVFDYDVVEGANATEGVAIARTGMIDVVLVDARMPERDGIWVVREIRKTFPDMPIIVLSTYETEDYVDGALEAGANGYVLKESSAEQLREALETAVNRRGLYLSPAVAHRLYSRSGRHESHDSRLTERELQVLQLLAEGFRNHDIARTLFVSEKTVKTHLASIFRKLAVTNRTHAVSKGIQERLVCA